VDAGSYNPDCRYLVSVRRLEGNHAIGCWGLKEATEKAKQTALGEDVIECVVLERMADEGIFDAFWHQLELVPGPHHGVGEPLFPDGTPRRERQSDLGS
jgi:hypothetical protein